MLAKENIQAIYALSPMQEGIFFQANLDDASSAYLQQVAYRLEGGLDVALLEKSLDVLVSRYDILRTVFVQKTTDRPVQVVLRDRKCSFCCYDCLSDPDPEAFAAGYKLRDRENYFDLGKDLLMRVAVIRLAPDRYELVWTYHHILMDGWCINVLYNDFTSIYLGLAAGREHGLPPVRSYRDYIAWLEKRGGKDDERAYWRRYLEGYHAAAAVPGLRLPGDAAEQYQLREVVHRVGAVKSAALRKVAASNRVTYGSLIHALWAIVLGRYSQSSDVVFGSVVSGRPPEIPGIETMVGLFINTIPVRVRLEPEAGFSELLQQVQQGAAEAEPHHYHRLSEIQAESALKQHLLNHLVIIENYPVSAPTETGAPSVEGGPGRWKVTHSEWFEQTHYGFNLLIHTAGELTFSFKFNGNAYDPAFVARIGTHLETLIDQVLAGESGPIRSLSLLPDRDKAQILARAPGEESSAGGPDLAGLFGAQAALRPDAVAVTGDRLALTYRQLDAWSDRLAARIAGYANGQPGGCCAIRMHSLECAVVAVIAACKAGVAYLPVGTHWPKEQTDALFARLQPLVVVTDDEDWLSGNRQAACIDVRELQQPANAFTFPRRAVGRHEPACIACTFTGNRPASLAITQATLLRQLQWVSAQCPITPRDAILLQTPLDLNGPCWELFAALCNGATCVVSNRRLTEDILGLIDCVNANGVTHLHLSPVEVRRLTKALAGNPELSLPTLKQVFTGPEPLPAQTLEACHRHLKSPLCYWYSRPEAGGAVAAGPIPRDGTSRGGTPVAGTTVLVLDGYRQLVPDGVTGRIAIGVPPGTVASGDPATGRLDWVTNPVAGGPALCLTDDWGRWLPDGRLEIVALRAGEAGPAAGCLREIEQRLSELAGMEEVKVIVRQDETQPPVVVAYYAGRPHMQPSEMTAYLNRYLPLPVLPEHFIRVDAFPLSPDGCIRAEGLPLPDRAGPGEAPTGEIEGKLGAIWEAVLGRGQIGANENFFRIAGDSIKATQIVARMYKAGYKIQIKDFMLNPTIRAIARIVQKLETPARQPSATGAFPLTPIQAAFFSNHPVCPAHFNQALVLHRAERFDAGAVRAVFSRIQEHHDALRTVFLRHAGRVHQTVSAAGPPPEFPVFDLAADPGAEAVFEREVDRIQRSMVLEKGPLMKLALFRLAAEDRLLIVIHHLVVDGISWRILLDDIQHLYRCYQQGKALQMPVKTDSYQAWAGKLAAYANSETFLREVPYWHDVEGAAVPVIRRDFEATPVHGKEAARVTSRLSARETEMLLTRVNEAFHTEINDILLTALLMAVRQMFGHDQVVVALEGHGREEILEDVSIAGTVGWFTAIYPVVLDAAGADTIARCIKEVKEQLRRVPNKGIGYGIYKYLTAREHRTGSGPAANPQILFNYLGQVDADVKDYPLGKVAPAPGYSSSPDEVSPYDLHVSGIIADGTLCLSIEYNRAQFRAETVQGLVDAYQGCLTEVVGYCLDRTFREVTPADLGYQALSIEDLENFFN